MCKKDEEIWCMLLYEFSCDLKKVLICYELVGERGRFLWLNGCWWKVRIDGCLMIGMWFWGRWLGGVNVFLKIWFKSLECMLSIWI